MGYFRQIFGSTREWLWPFFCVTCAYQTYIARTQIEDSKKTLSALKELQDSWKKRNASQAVSSPEQMLLLECMKDCITFNSTELTSSEEVCLRNCAARLEKIEEDRVRERNR